MWNKKTQEEEKPYGVPARETMGVSITKGSNKMGYIGESIIVKGELSGNEDLTVDGKVEGKIELKDHNLTIGAAGKVLAEICAKTVTVTGEVNGNVVADEKIEITSTGKVKGDLVAPRVTIADGAQFKGSVDMGKHDASEYGHIEKMDE